MLVRQGSVRGQQKLRRAGLAKDDAVKVHASGIEPRSTDQVLSTKPRPDGHLPDRNRPAARARAKKRGVNQPVARHPPPFALGRAACEGPPFTRELKQRGRVAPPTRAHHPARRGWRFGTARGRQGRVSAVEVALRPYKDAAWTGSLGGAVGGREAPSRWDHDERSAHAAPHAVV